MPSIAHIINPVAADPGSRSYFVQQVTYQTMVTARDNAYSNFEIEFLSVQYPEDHGMLPAGFFSTPDLERSVVDIARFNFSRKLPLLEDILLCAFNNSDADYFIYTNVDIGIMPYFYQTVSAYINKGFDAFTINRRTITEKFNVLSDIPLMYAEIGEAHRGWDCFVFKRNLVSTFQLGTVCVGAPLVGLAFIANLIANAQNFHEFTQEHITFHLGNDRSWHRSKYADYADHNKNQVIRIIRELDNQIDGFELKSPPGRYLYFHKNIFLSQIYAWMMRIYIPARFTRRTN